MSTTTINLPDALGNAVKRASQSAAANSPTPTAPDETAVAPRPPAPPAPSV